MRNKTIFLLLGVLTLSGCANTASVVGVQNVSPWNRRPTADSVSGYLLFAKPLGGGWTAHLQPIVPLNHPREVIVGVGVDYEFGHLFKSSP